MSGRKCGECTLCCSLLKVVPLQKPAYEKCTHQKAGGCGIYSVRPRACEIWSCQWLIGKDAEKLKRPDQAHFIVDILPHYPLLQIWIEDGYPDAWKSDRGLLDFIAKHIANRGVIIRHSVEKYRQLFPAELRDLINGCA